MNGGGFAAPVVVTVAPLVDDSVVLLTILLSTLISFTLTFKAFAVALIFDAMLRVSLSDSSSSSSSSSSSGGKVGKTTDTLPGVAAPPEPPPPKPPDRRRAPPTILKTWLVTFWIILSSS